MQEVCVFLLILLINSEYEHNQYIQMFSITIKSIYTLYLYSFYLVGCHRGSGTLFTKHSYLLLRNGKSIVCPKLLLRSLFDDF